MPKAEDQEMQRAWSEDRDRRMAERQAEQERMHAADPYRVPKYIPVDDEEFPTESFTASWTDEEPEDGFIDWDGSDSDDAADSSSAGDLNEDHGVPTGDHM